MCREVVNSMLKQEIGSSGIRGTILNMSSILGISPEPKFFSTVAYAAAKGGIISMSRTMASTYAKDKIRVNVIAPALAMTRMSARASTDPVIAEFMAAKQPLKGGIMDASEVAHTSYFLLNNESSMITGQVVQIDAGWGISG